MSFVFSIIHEVPRVAAPGDLLARTFGNHTTFPVPPAGHRLSLELDLEATTIINTSTFPTGHRLVETVETDLFAVTIENEQTFPSPPGHELLVEPPLVVLFAVTIENASTFPTAPGHELVIAPDEAYLYATTVENESTFGTHILQLETFTDEDSDAIVAGFPVGDVPS